MLYRCITTYDEALILAQIYGLRILEKIHILKKSLIKRRVERIQQTRINIQNFVQKLSIHLRFRETILVQLENSAFCTHLRILGISLDGRPFLGLMPMFPFWIVSMSAPLTATL